MGIKIKIRDSEDVFKNAELRDEETKLLFTFDYDDRTLIRIWGTGLKPALHKERLKLGVRIYERGMAVLTP